MGSHRLPLALSLTFVAACGGGPESAVRRFLDIAATHHRQRLFDELAPGTQYRLKQDAERAAMMTGQRSIAPAQLLSVEVPPGAYRLHTLSKSGNNAEVEAQIGDLRQRFRVVKVAGRWKIEL